MSKNDEMKINAVSIVIDTNKLYGNYNDFTKACCVDTLNSIISSLEAHDLYEGVKILLPSIVLEESRLKQIKKYDEEVNKIINKVFPESEIRKLDDYESYINKEFEDLISNFSSSQIKIEILGYPQNNCFSLLIEKAIHGMPPFEGKDKQTDKGFKDAVIWEAIKEYKALKRDEIIILYTGDSRLKDVASEYKELFSEELNICDEQTELASIVAEIQNKPIEYSSFVEEIQNQIETKNIDSTIEYIYKDSSVLLCGFPFIIKDVDIKDIERLVQIDTPDDNELEFIMNISASFTIESEKLLSEKEMDVFIEKIGKQQGVHCYSGSNVSAKVDDIIEIVIVYLINDKRFFVMKYDSIFGTVFLSEDLELLD